MRYLTPRGRPLPDNLWPCHCCVCGREMSGVRFVETDAQCEVTYTHRESESCKNTQRTTVEYPSS